VRLRPQAHGHSSPLYLLTGEPTPEQETAMVDAKHLIFEGVRRAAQVGAVPTAAGFVGFAIGRSTWRDAVRGYLDDSLDRDPAAQRIADNYLRFVDVFRGGQG
jgi:Uncharacterized protein conserved in bacteria (DUF2090)